VRTIKVCLSLIPAVASIAIASNRELTPPIRAEVRDLHTKVIVPASGALFEAEREIPGTDHHWQDLQGIAKELAKASGQLLAINDGKSEPNWLKHATSLRDESESIAKAAGAKNHEAIVAGNGRLLSACNACHAEYRGGK